MHVFRVEEGVMARAGFLLSVFLVVGEGVEGAGLGWPPAERATEAARQEAIFADDFETDLGWTIEGGDNASGRWSRVVPVGTSAQPAADYSPSPGRYCYVTGQHFGGGAGTNDVDEATVILTSPEIDLPCDDVEVGYVRWFHCSGDGVEDFLTVEFSRDGGGSWTTAEVVGGVTGWVESGFRLRDFPAATGPTLLVRFWTVDAPNDSLTEAALDEFRVATVDCSRLRGDANDDGVVDLLDYRTLCECLSGPNVAATDPTCMLIDLNGNGRVDLADYDAFQSVFGMRR